MYSDNFRYIYIYIEDVKHLQIPYTMQQVPYICICIYLNYISCIFAHARSWPLLESSLMSFEEPTADVSLNFIGEYHGPSGTATFSS